MEYKSAEITRPCYPSKIARCCRKLRYVYVSNFTTASSFLFLQEWRFGRSRSSKVIDFGTNRKHACDFRLVRHSNLGPLLRCFRDIADFLCWYPTPISPYFGGYSHWTRLPMLGSIWAGTLSSSAVKLLSNYCNRCDHGTWTSQADRGTYRQPTYCDTTALCALRSIAR